MTNEQRANVESFLNWFWSLDSFQRECVKKFIDTLEATGMYGTYRASMIARDLFEKK